MNNDPKPDSNTDDPFFVSDNPEDARDAILKELGGEEDSDRKKHLVDVVKANYDSDNGKDWGHTIDSDDPIHGYSDNPDTINQFALDEIDRVESARANSITPEDVLPEPEEIDTSSESKIEDNGKGIERGVTTEEDKEQKERLEKVFRECVDIRAQYKNPGHASYRLLSVAATKMERIEQPDDRKERTKVINAEIKKAAEKAVGEETLGKYEGDIVAGVQAYVSEILIGENADSVSIGTTGAVINANGQIGTDPEKYKNMVVIRWVQGKMNNVFVFSPRRDAGLYVLADGSMNNKAWRRKFLMAGSVNGEDRREVSKMKHELQDDEAHHERSLENVVNRMLDMQRESISDMDLSIEEKAQIEREISSKRDQLAYAHRKKLGMRHLFEEEEHDKAIKEQPIDDENES